MRWISTKSEPHAKPEPPAMDETAKDLGRSLESWRGGHLSLDEVRSLAIGIGNARYPNGIPALIELLDHEDGIVRYNAVVSLGFDLHYVPAVDKLLKILSADEDDDCRGAAAAALGNLRADSKDHVVLDALGKAALNDPDEDARISAYKALLSVNGLSREEHLNVLSDQRLLVDPERVQAILRH